MNLEEFREVRKILNNKLIKLWALRNYPSEEEKHSDEMTRKIQFIQKLKAMQYLLKKSILQGVFYTLPNIWICFARKD